MRNLWKDTGLTIVLLPSGKQGDDLYAVARLWTELRLLSPALWIRSEMLRSSETKPPEQTAFALGNGVGGALVEVKVDLFNQLARQEVPSLRLLTVRPISPDAEFDQAQDKLSKVIAEYLNLSMPGGGGGSNRVEARSKLSLLNVVTAPTEKAIDFGSQIAGLQFNANFVAAAEDRTTPHALDGFITAPEGSKKFAGHTMLHVATVGGLWVGLPQATLELLKVGVANFGEQAFASRVFLSAILTDGLARRAASRVLIRAADADQGVVDLARTMPIDGTYQIPEDKTESFINQLVQNTFDFDSRVLSYQPPVAARDFGPKDWSLREQIADFFKFAWDKITRVPYFAWRWLVRVVADIANRVFQSGDQGAARVRKPNEELDARDRAIQTEYLNLKSAKQRADEALVSPVTPSPIRSTPELWRQLRSMLFAILDGANIEHFGFKREEDKVPIFHKASALFKDPAVKLAIIDPDQLDQQVVLDWAATNDSLKLLGKYSAAQVKLNASNAEQAKTIEAAKQTAARQAERVTALKEQLDLLTGDIATSAGKTDEHLKTEGEATNE